MKSADRIKPGHPVTEISARALLLIMLAVMLLPFTALTAWLAIHQFRGTVAAKGQENLDLARLAAAHYEQFVHDSETMLQVLAQRPKIRALDPAHCDPVLEDMRQLQTLYANVATMARNGRLVCSALPMPGSSPISVVNFPWYAAVVGQTGFYVTEPFVSRIGGIHVTMLTYPLRDDHGAIVGHIGLLINLARLQKVLSSLTLPDGTAVTLLSAGGALLARLPTLPDHAGADDYRNDVPGEAGSKPGILEVAGPDGIDRIYGSAGVRRAGWSVHVGTPKNVLLRPAYETARDVALTFLSGLSIMALLTLVAYRKARQWAATLESAAKAIEGGEQSVRFTAVGPREVRRIIGALNSMLDTLAHTGAELRRALDEQQKLAASLEAERGRLVDAQAVGKMGSWELDVVSGVLLWSDETYRIFEMQPSEFGATYEAFLAAIHPDDRAAVIKADTDATESRLPLSVEHRIVLKDGRIKHVVERGQVVYSDDGRRLRRVGTVQDVTERKQAELALQASERRQRELTLQLASEKERLVEAQAVAKLGSWETDFATLKVTWSEEMYRIFESDPRTFQPTHQGFLQLVHPDDRAAVDEAFVRSFGERSPHDIQHRLLLPDGRIKFVEERWQTFVDENGKPVRALGTSRDITESRRALQAVVDSEARLSALIENSSDIITITGLDGRISYVSPSIRKVAGYEPGEVIGINFMDLVAPEDREAAAVEFKALASQPGRVQRVERRYRRKDGSWMESENIAVNLVHVAGVNGFVSNIRDVTERKRAAEAMHFSEERFRQLAENISDVFWITDPDKNQMVYISPAYEKIWGRTCASLYDSPAAWIEAIHPEDRARVAHAAVTRQVGGTYDEVYRIVRPGGETRWIRDRAFPIRDEQGHAYRVVGIAEDVTQERVARLRLEALLQGQRALSRRIGEVREDERQRLSAELHDRIGQNLTALGIELVLVADSLPSEAAQKNALRLRDARALVEATTASVRDLITELRPPVLADYGLLAALRGYAEELRIRTSIPIRVEGSEPEPRLPPATEIALFRIAQEALTNALKHAPACDVLVRLESGPLAVRLSITDNGPGFDRAALEPGARGHWGLAIMEERAEAIGAVLVVAAAPGHGTRVTVRVRREP